MDNKLFRSINNSMFLGVLFSCAVASQAAGEVGIGININIGPPPITVAAPPAVVMVPQSQVYFVPGASFDVFFHNGYWWSPRGDVWYRSRAYNGPWGVVDRRYVPPPVIHVPRDYQHVYGKERHIPYGQWKKEHSRDDHGHKDNHGHGHDKEHGQGHDKGH